MFPVGECPTKSGCVVVGGDATMVKMFPIALHPTLQPFLDHVNVEIKFVPMDNSVTMVDVITVQNFQAVEKMAPTLSVLHVNAEDQLVPVDNSATMEDVTMFQNQLNELVSLHQNLKAH